MSRLFRLSTLTYIPGDSSLVVSRTKFADGRRLSLDLTRLEKAGWVDAHTGA